MALDSFLNGDFCCKLHQRVSPELLLDLCRGVLIDKFVDRQIATANAHLNLVLLYLNVDTLAAKSVYAGTLTQKHNLELSPIRIVIDVLSNFHVHRVLCLRNVDSDSSLDLQDVRFQVGDLLFVSFALLQQVKGSFVGAVDFLLQCLHVVGGRGKIRVQLCLLCMEVPD